MFNLIHGKIWEPPDYSKYIKAGKFAVKIICDNYKDQGLIECTSVNFVKDLNKDDHVVFVGSWKDKNHFSFRTSHNITRNKTTGNNPFLPVAVSLIWFILTAIILDILGAREYIYHGAVIPVLLFSYLTWKYRTVADMIDHFDRYNNKLNGGYCQVSNKPRSDVEVCLSHILSSFHHGDSNDDPLTWESIETSSMDLMDMSLLNAEATSVNSPLCNDPFSDDPFCSSHVGGAGHFSEDAFCGDVAHLHDNSFGGDPFQSNSFDNDPFSNDF